MLATPRCPCVNNFTRPTYKKIKKNKKKDRKKLGNYPKLALQVKKKKPQIELNALDESHTVAVSVS